MSTTSLVLANGDVMPPVGLGFWQVEKEAAAEIVEQAFDAGYRHFDCACDYGNEVEVGEGLARVLRSGRVKRDALWITSKLWNTYHRAEHVKPAIKRSLSDLKLDYLDLYLIHFPISLQYVPFEKRYPPAWFFDPESAEPRMQYDLVPVAETWQAMEELVQAGLVRNIGVSNFGTSLLRDLLSYKNIAPAMLQVEMHPYLTQEKLLRFCTESGIAVTAFSPLGAESYYKLNMAESSESVLAHPVIQQIAKQRQRSAAQVTLRWGIQRGTAVVPKTSQVERLSENISLFDFSLSAAEMTAINGLDQNRRFNDPGVFCESVFNTLCPIYE